MSKHLKFLLFVVISVSASQNGTEKLEKQFVDWASKQFSNRMLWMTHNRKFVLPKGTILQVTPKITVPVFRHAPYNGGFDSDVQASWTFYMKFDKLNMTSDDHPWPFDRPPFYPFGEMMRPDVGPKDQSKSDFPKIKYTSEEPKNAKMQLIRTKNYYPGFGTNSRKPRAVMSLPPPGAIFGGERATILPSIEKLAASLGFKGRECLLRTVCEVHEFPLARSGGYGLFGELVTLFFTISESPYSQSHLPEYLKAEEKGRSGDCSVYKRSCDKSIFVWEPKV